MRDKNKKGSVYFGNVTVAELKKMLQGLSDNDTLFIAVDMKGKPATAKPTIAKPITIPGGKPPLLPDVTVTTCQGKPIVYKFGPYKNGSTFVARPRKRKFKNTRYELKRIGLETDNSSNERSKSNK